MKKFSLFLACVIAVLGVVFGLSCTQKQKAEIPDQELELLRSIAVPPPSSLDALFPPQADRPIWQERMMGMAMPFSGILVDLLENDFANAQANLEAFKAQYTEISKLVPEWEKDFLLESVTELEEALKSGDQAKIMPAYEKVGNVCHDCHVLNMAKVQYKYHWKDFRTIKVIDPLTDKTFDYRELMQNLDLNFVGVIVDLGQGQKENALKHFQDFKTRFNLLKDACGECHGTEERKYFVDDSVLALVDQFGQAISGESVDPKQAEALSMGIGMESCFKCHWVHVPSSFAKYQWEKLSKLKGSS